MNVPDLSSIRNLTELLTRTPNGAAIAELGRRLGLWTAAAHSGTQERRAFAPNLGSLEAETLSNENGYWTSEFGRLSELAGLLVGQKQQLAAEGKRLRASARSRARRALPEGSKAPTQGVLNDMAEEDLAVIAADQHLITIEAMLSFVQGTKEATAQYLASISREIAYRDAQMKARLY